MKLAFQRPETWDPGVGSGADRTIPLRDGVNTLSRSIHREEAGSEKLAECQN